MPRRTCRAFVVAIALLPHVVSAQGVTLEELVRLAVRSSYEVRMVQEEIAKTDAQIEEARGGAMPTITASAQYQYAFESVDMLGGGAPFSDAEPLDSAAFFDALRQDPAASDNDFRLGGMLYGLLSGLEQMDFTAPPHALLFSLELRQALFAQGKVSIGLRIAKAYKQTLYCSYDEARQKVVAEVTRLFYAALLARDNGTVRERGLELAREAHALAVKRMQLGDGSVLDTLGTRLEVEKGVVTLREARSRERIARDALARASFMGERLASMELLGELEEPTFTLSLEEAQRNMERNNKALGRLQGLEVMQELLVRLKRSDYLPTVYGGGSVGKMYLFDSPDRLELRGPGTTDAKVFVGASLTLFDGFKRTRRVQQSRSELRSHELLVLKTIDNLRIGLLAAWEEMENNRSTLASVELMVELAEQGWQAAQQMYRAGALTQLELERRRNELNEARLARNGARYTLLTAVLDLGLLMGTLTIE